MRSMLVVAGLAGVLAVAGCGKSKESTKGALPATTGGTVGRGTGVTAPGTGAGTATEGAVVPPSSPADIGPDTSFELATQQPAAVGAAAQATARLVVHPGPGMKMNTDYPTGLTLTPPAGVKLGKVSFAGTDAEKFDLKELTFAVPMSADAPGEYRVPGTFKFAVCDEGACYPKKRAVELVLAVQ